MSWNNKEQSEKILLHFLTMKFKRRRSFETSGNKQWHSRFTCQKTQIWDHKHLYLTFLLSAL